MIVAEMQHKTLGTRNHVQLLAPSVYIQTCVCVELSKRTRNLNHFSSAI